MRNPGAVIDRRGLQIGERARDRVAIQQVDRVPQHTRIGGEVWLTASLVCPRGHGRFLLEQVIDEVTAGKTRGARDQRRTRHGR